MVYGYIRVSTGKQTVENQKYAIQAFCERSGLTVDAWIEETVSGAKRFDKRKLGDLLGKVQTGDAIICTEITRLGRSLFMIFSIMSYALERGCAIWTIKEGWRLGDDLTSEVLAFVFGMAAEIERALISERTRDALARKKAEGIPPGAAQGGAGQAREAHRQKRFYPDFTGPRQQLRLHSPVPKGRPLHTCPFLQRPGAKTVHRLQQNGGVVKSVAG